MIALKDLGVAWRWLPCEACGSTASHRFAARDFKGYIPDNRDWAYRTHQNTAPENRARVFCVNREPCRKRMDARGAGDTRPGAWSNTPQEHPHTGAGEADTGAGGLALGAVDTIRAGA